METTSDLSTEKSIPFSTLSVPNDFSIPFASIIIWLDRPGVASVPGKDSPVRPISRTDFKYTQKPRAEPIYLLCRGVNRIYGASQISQKPRAMQIKRPAGTATGSREIPLIGGAGGLEELIFRRKICRGVNRIYVRQDKYRRSREQCK